MTKLGLRKSKKIGPPQQNTNSLKHGLCLDLQKRRLDGRYRLAKAIKHIERQIILDLGGDSNVSMAQLLLIERITHKAMNLRFMEFSLMNGETEVSDRYVTLSNSLRADLTALGLERRQKEYEGYLDETQTHKEGKKNA